MQKEVFCFDNAKNMVITCLIALIVFGSVNMYSASFIYGTQEMGSAYHFLLRYAIGVVASIISLAIVRKVGYKTFMQDNWLFILGCLAFLSLIFVQFLGVEVNSARRWLSLGFIRVQPSEFVKLFIIIYCSAKFGALINKGKRVNMFYRPGATCLGVAVLLGLMVAVEPDAGTGIFIFGLAFCLAIIGGLRIAQIAIIAMLSLGVVVILLLLAPYRLARIISWWHPWDDPTGAGYQMVQSFIAIGSGKLTGMEWGSGISKFHFLPELHTDFAFAVFCQENGFIGALFLILVFLALAYALWVIVRRTTDSQGALLVSGVIFLVVGQSILNMAMVCGVLPISGVPLSFISYGGSNMVVATTALGLALSVYDEQSKKEERQALIAKAVAESPEDRRRQWQIIEGGKK